MKKNFIIFGLVFLLILLLIIPIFTIVKTTPLNLVFSQRNILINFFIRITGLTVYVLLFIQIMIGTFWGQFKKIFTKYTHKVHFINGLLIILTVLIHLALLIIYNYFIKRVIDPFYVFTDVCVLCRNTREVFFTLGRVSFWLIIFGMITAIWHKEEWFKLNWEKIHLLNYLIFFLITIHMRFLGSDVLTIPFSYFYNISIIAVLLVLVFKLLKLIYGKVKFKQ